jgi:hypothetical protein
MSGPTTVRGRAGGRGIACRAALAAAAVLALPGCPSSGVELVAGPDAARTDDARAAEDADGAREDADGDGGETIRPPCVDDRDCDDANPCTRDDCRRDAAGGAACVRVALDGGACDDDDTCTAHDACLDGVCRGVPISCDDGDPCTHDSCSPGSGCLHPRTDVYYRDGDGDGWGTGREAGCGWPVPPGFAVRNGDCCDADAAVHPAAAFHDLPYACDAASGPSFDWDCDGVDTRESTDLASDCMVDPFGCLGVAPGWCGPDLAHPECTGVPDCGVAGTWQAGCTLEPAPESDAGGSVDAGTGGAARPDAGLYDVGDVRSSDAFDVRRAKESPAWDDAGPPDYGEISGWVCVRSLAPRTQRCR